MEDPVPASSVTPQKLTALVDDRELLARLRRDDTGAFDDLFRRYYAPLVGLADAMLRQRAVAEEIVQDVMLALWRRRETLTVEESVRAYLYQSVRNRALNEVRRARVEKKGEPRAVGPSAVAATAPAELEAQEMDAALRRAMQAMPAPVRETFEMSRVSGLRYVEIAQVLGISVKTVEARMGKALKTLRDELAPWLPRRE